ncbi:hypothetical protein F975_01586 [Acinetobacter sp. ANC 3789]|nr:hypothetical protein F975_01586 [Acinetobacter sp. ANC 3789]
MRDIPEAFCPLATSTHGLTIDFKYTIALQQK